MKANTTKHLIYSQPGVEILQCKSNDIICTSPNPGENEGIGYEPWSFEYYSSNQ